MRLQTVRSSETQHGERVHRAVNFHFDNQFGKLGIIFAESVAVVNYYVLRSLASLTTLFQLNVISRIERKNIFVKMWKESNVVCLRYYQIFSWCDWGWQLTQLWHLASKLRIEPRMYRTGSRSADYWTTTFLIRGVGFERFEIMAGRVQVCGIHIWYGTLFFANFLLQATLSVFIWSLTQVCNHLSSGTVQDQASWHVPRSSRCSWPLLVSFRCPGSLVP